jgi:integrase
VNIQPETGPEVIRGEVVTGMPNRKELILQGRAALAEKGIDPDDFVDDRAQEQLRRAMPENTKDALAWAWGFLVRYCGETGRRHEPEAGKPAPTVGTIRQMIADAYYMTKADGSGRGRYGRPYAPTTIELVVYCLSMIFDRLQWVNPCRHPLVADQLKGYRSDYIDRDGYKTDEADALTSAQSVLLARTQDLGTVQGLRNAAMMRGQFDLGCRADEWCKVRGEDVVWLDEEHVVIEFVRTKGGKKRKVPMQALPKVDADVDPALLLNAYMKARMSIGWDGTGPLWVEVARGDRRNDFLESRILGGRFLDEPMKYGAYAAVFNRAVAKTGIDIDPVSKKKNRHYTTHSNRIGLIDEASRNGMRLEDIAPRTGHSPASPVIHKYLRERAQWGDANPGVMIRQHGVASGDAK